MRKYTRLLPLPVVLSCIMPVSKRIGRKFVRTQYKYMIDKMPEYTEVFLKMLRDKEVTEKYPIFSEKDHLKLYKHYLLEYGMYPEDYFLLDAYKKSDLAMNTYCTMYNEWHDIIDEFNKGADYSVMTNKVRFNKTFADYINREWLYIDENTSLRDFEEFLKGREKFVIKPAADTNQGDGVEVIEVKTLDSPEKIRKMFNKIKTEKLLVEEFIKQTGVLHEINPMTVNTVRIVTMCLGGKAEVAFAVLKTGIGNSFVDNFSHGGLKMPIDIETGIVSAQARGKKGRLYINHPYTGKQLLGLKIPNWENAKNTVIKAAESCQQLPYLGWDVAISDDKVAIVEGNNRSMICGFQFPEFDGYKEQFIAYRQRLDEQRQKNK